MQWRNSQGILAILEMQKQILLDYEEDITKYAHGLDQGKILSVYRKIPAFLANEIAKAKLDDSNNMKINKLKTIKEKKNKDEEKSIMANYLSEDNKLGIVYNSPLVALISEPIKLKTFPS